VTADVSPVPPPPARRGWLATTEPASSATELIGTAGRLTVDGRDLRAVGDYLNELGTATRAIMREAATADAAASLHGLRYSSLGDDKITNVVDMRLAYVAATRQLDTDLGNLAKTLERTAAAMAKIAKRYRTADERNKVDADTVRKMLGGSGHG
jgi:hypothetical protein